MGVTMEIETEILDNGRLFVNRDFLGLLEKNSLESADQIWNLRDESVKKVLRQRGTGRIYLNPPHGAARIETYIKRYTRVPLRERIRCIFSLKFFQFDALHEWHAQLVFHRLELPTVIPIAAGRTSRGSFNLTLGITDYKRASAALEEIGQNQTGRRLEIIEKIAAYAGRMHGAGLAHQDLYLVHFFLKGRDMVPHLIDLQRVIKEKELSMRWRIKDLGELLFSARPIVSSEEIEHFCRAYSSASGFNLKEHPRVVRALKKRADRIEARHRRKTAHRAEKV